MRTFLTITFCCITALVFGQQIKAYNLDVTIDVPTKKVKVHGTIIIDFETKESISTVLWKNSKIHSISANNKSALFNFEGSKPSPIIWIDEGRELIINNPSEQTGDISLAVDYESNFTGMETSAESFTKEWIQIGFYNAWFPVDLNSKEATSTIRVHIDKAYKVSGSGIVTKKGNVWEISQPWGSYDNVIIASKSMNIKKTVRDDVTIETVYTDFSDEKIVSIVETSQTVLDYFNNIFPKKDKAYLKFVVKHSENGGGYNRPNFISLRLKQINLNTKKTIAHEVAHFWATGADSSSWEDWLNESFAEYSALMYIRDFVDKEAFNTLISKYQKSTVKLGAIWNMDRSSNDSYLLLYRKGVLILHQLENKIGKELFSKILYEKSNKNIQNTNDFLVLLAKETTQEISVWLEKALKN